MIDLNNPAGRFYEIIDKLGKRDEKEQLRNAWAAVLDFDPDDTQALLFNIAKVIHLMDVVEELIGKRKVNIDLYLKHFDEIRNIFTVNYTQNVQSIKGYLHRGTMSSLQHCADRISEDYEEKPISEQEIEDLLVKIVKLRKKVVKTDLPEFLSRMILENLRRIQDGIEDYRIFGSDELRDSIVYVYGSHDLFKREQQETNYGERAKTIIREYITIIEEVLSIASNAYIIAKVAAPEIAGFLGAG